MSIMSTQIIRDQKGKVLAYVQQIGKDRWNVLDRKGALVAREFFGDTYTATGKYIGKGRQGLTLVQR
jgi:hypothetical protein